MYFKSIHQRHFLACWSLLFSLVHSLIKAFVFELEKSIECKCINLEKFMVSFILIRLISAGSRKRKLSSSHDDISDMIDHDRYYHVQSPSMLAPSPLNNDFHTFDQQRRRSSAMSEGRRPSYPAVDRRPSVPFSPPHQTYDHYRHPMEYDKGYYYHHQQQMMIPSPPPSLLKSNDFRRLSMEDRTPLRRQSADSYYSTHPYEPRRLSLQHTTKEEVIHLPPLRSVIASGSKPQEGVVEVNAAVAMMELSTRQQQNK